MLVTLCVLAQAIDSFIFFWGAFGHDPERVAIMLNGFAWKAALTLPLSLALFARSAEAYDPRTPEPS